MLSERAKLTNNHDVEVEAFADTLAVPLVWQIGKANVTGQLPANNVLVLNDATRESCDRGVR